MGMRDQVRRVRYFVLMCRCCEDSAIEGFPPETPQDVVETARQCGWKFVEGETLCKRCIERPRPKPESESQDSN